MDRCTLSWSPQAERASGVLLHPTSLPGLMGIGDLGAGAQRFIEFLAAAGQRLWQFMPLGPVGVGNSPYATSSAFAGNPLLIALRPLIERGLLPRTFIEQLPPLSSARVDYAATESANDAVLDQISERFDRFADPSTRAAFSEFCASEAAWLDDFALFMALKKANDGQPWFEWPADLVHRETTGLDRARRELAVEIRKNQLAQYLFFEQWRALKSSANARGIALVGDIPIFVAHDSVDVWVNQDIFELDCDGRATVVAGVPPDYFSVTGQRWGNPLYRWKRLADRGYDWWIERFRGALQLADLVRLDHFRGFAAHWEVPAENETAEHGRWVEGPGLAIFTAVEHALGRLPVIVEDLGLITPEVEQLRRDVGYPGMKVLQFAFGDDAHGQPSGRGPHLPHNFSENCVVYTGTHDNDTTIGWFSTLDDAERHSVRRYLAVGGHDIAWDLIRCALGSVARTAILPLQDIMSLGSEARMNVPGRPDANWCWRYRPDQLSDELAARLAELTSVYGRGPLAQDVRPRPA